MSNQNAKKLTIGFVAKAADVNIETIRYYQRIGLIAEPIKPLQGFRVYPTETLKRIKFIKRAQQLGFSLKEVAELLLLGDGSTDSKCADVRQRAEQKREHIVQQINDLQNLRQTLTQFISSCKKENGTRHCAIVETLSA
jgi:MerR family mercuric resistance operon transcriptional regulator